MARELDPPGEDDGLDGLVLDDDFVRAANVVEGSAAERSERASRIRYQHEHLQRSQARADRSAKRRERGWLRRNLLPLSIFVGVIVGTLVVSHWSTSLTGIWGSPPALANASPSAPPPGVDEAAHPLGQPAPLRSTSSSYRFMFTQADGKKPVTYDPCRPIHYVVRPDHEPAQGLAMVQAAVGTISQATGLHFVYDGTTSEAPGNDRALYQPKRYGQRWAPVLIAWETPEEQPSFAASTVGLGGSLYLEAPTLSQRTYVTGTVELSSTAFDGFLSNPKTTSLARAVILHELGHLVGLDHVTDPEQVMYPETQLVTTSLGAGDLTGLSLLGSGACQPKL